MTVRRLLAGKPGSGRHRALAEINITPLVDVMLVLLIISMLAAPMLQKGIPLDLPATETSQDIRDPRTVVSLDRDGRIRLNDQPVHPDLLQQRMKALVTGSPGETVFLLCINANCQKTDWGQVVVAGAVPRLGRRQRQRTQGRSTDDDRREPESAGRVR